MTNGQWYDPLGEALVQPPWQKHQHRGRDDQDPREGLEQFRIAHRLGMRDDRHTGHKSEDLFGVVRASRAGEAMQEVCSTCRPCHAPPRETDQPRGNEQDDKAGQEVHQSQG